LTALRRAEAVAVTVFPDDNKKYLSTDLLKEEPRKPDFISSSVDLLRYKAQESLPYLLQRMNAGGTGAKSFSR